VGGGPPPPRAPGPPPPRRADVVAAARAVGADDFVARLPDGYDTVVGERGSALSAGQRQLICLARAALADPAVLLLDEATSGLDPESEARVHAAIRALGRRRTVVLVTHRIPIARDADRIAVVAGGRIAEYGTHDALLAHGGRYAAMCELWRTPPSATVRST
jgi:ABC-type multidrug transport system fused ATPase/permease subunit